MMVAMLRPFQKFAMIPITEWRISQNAITSMHDRCRFHDLYSEPFRGLYLLPPWTVPQMVIRQRARTTSPLCEGASDCLAFRLSAIQPASLAHDNLVQDRRAHLSRSDMYIFLFFTGFLSSRAQPIVPIYSSGTGIPTENLRVIHDMYY